MTASTALVTGVDFVCVPTRDLSTAMGFYGDVLGLRAPASGSGPARSRWGPSSRPAP